MGPLGLLHCVVNAALKADGNLLGLGLGDVAELVWNEWDREKAETARKAERQALIQMTAGELRPHSQNYSPILGKSPNRKAEAEGSAFSTTAYGSGAVE